LLLTRVGMNAVLQFTLPLFTHLNARDKRLSRFTWYANFGNSVR
jgi:hypothetical protein